MRTTFAAVMATAALAGPLYADGLFGDSGFGGRVDLSLSHLEADFASQTGINVSGRFDLPFRVSALAEFTQLSGTSRVTNLRTGEQLNVDGRISTSEFGLGARVLDTEALMLVPYVALFNLSDVFSVGGSRFRARQDGVGYGVDLDFDLPALPVDVFGTYFFSPELDDDGSAFASYFEVGGRVPVTLGYYDIEARAAWRNYNGEMNQFFAGGSVPF